MKLLCLRGNSLNTIVYRGFTKVSELARISEPDVFDQETNPEGTQRDLKAWHAREAYAYAAGNIERETVQRIWPEIILNVRETDVVQVKEDEEENLVVIEIYEEKIEKRGGVNPQISRVDGNHRLYYANGSMNDSKKISLEKLDVIIPFMMTIGLNRKEESAIFSDINSNAMKMNTSHLDHLKYRLAKKSLLKKEELPLWIAEELAHDSESPFYNLIYLGGKRSRKYLLSLRTLKTGINYLLNDSQELIKNDIPFELKLKAIKTYWVAVRNAFLKEWSELIDKSRANLLLASYSYYAMSKIGALVIDSSFRREDLTVNRMQSILLNIKDNIDWSKDGQFKGIGGKSGSDVIYSELRKLLPLEYRLEETLKKLKEE